MAPLATRNTTPRYRQTKVIIAPDTIAELTALALVIDFTQNSLSSAFAGSLTRSTASSCSWTIFSVSSRWAIASSL